MPLVGIFNFPHGTLPFDAEKRDTTKFNASKSTTTEDCVRLHRAMRKTAAELVNTSPDLIVLTTPHGIKRKNTYLVYSGDVAKGNAEWLGGWSEYTAEINIDKQTSDYLVLELQKRGNCVESLKSESNPPEPLLLKLGEVVPWWYFAEEAKKVNFSLPKAVIISTPFSGRAGEDKRKEKIPGALKLGYDIYDILKDGEYLKNKRIAIITSIDLSHNHSNDPTTRFPFVDTCKEFDQYQINWAKLDINSTNLEKSNEELMVKAGGLVDSNTCCGFIGAVISQGLMQREVTNGTEFAANFVDYAVPTYYGMMASYFLPK